MLEFKFKVGDKIRLKDYSLYSDYEDHFNEIAIIEWIGNNSGNRAYGIIWEDENPSTIWFNNMVLATPISQYNRLKRMGILK